MNSDTLYTYIFKIYYTINHIIVKFKNKVTTENPKSAYSILHYWLHFLSKTQDTRKPFLSCYSSFSFKIVLLFEFKELYPDVTQTKSDEWKHLRFAADRWNTSMSCHDSTSQVPSRTGQAQRSQTAVHVCPLSTSFLDAGSLPCVRSPYTRLRCGLYAANQTNRAGNNKFSPSCGYKFSQDSANALTNWSLLEFDLQDLSWGPSPFPTHPYWGRLCFLG
jgi:hypothetical protein